MNNASADDCDTPQHSYDDVAVDMPDAIACATDSDLDDMMEARLAKCRGLQLLRQCVDSCPPLNPANSHTATSPIAIPRPKHHSGGFALRSDFRSEEMHISPLSHAAEASESVDCIATATGTLKLEESDLVPRPAHPPPDILNSQNLTSGQWDRPDGLLSPEDILLVRHSIRTVDGIIPTRPSALSVEGWRQLGDLCLERVEALGETYPTISATWVQKACVNRAKQMMRHAKNAFKNADAMEAVLVGPRV